MNSTLQLALDGKRESREYFLKHLNGLDDGQWDFKPFAEGKSIRQTLQHLIIDDQSAIDSLRSNQEPDYESYQESEGSPNELLAILARSHEELLAEISKLHPAPSEDSTICIWGTHRPFRNGVAWLSSEDFYHAGQVAMLRMASCPEWDYYKAIYGMEFTQIIGSETNASG